METALQAKGECLRFLDQSARKRATPMPKQDEQ